MLDLKPFITNFPELKARATDLDTPNTEDHFRIRLAMIGFSRASDLRRWKRQHFEFVQGRLDGDLSPDDFSTVWIDFACLMMGYLLGLLDAGASNSEQEFGIADAQLPGCMWMHAGDIEQLGNTA